MKKNILIVLFLFILVYTNAQKKQNDDIHSIITGKVADSLNNSPIEYATITLYKQGEKKAINGTITNHDGIFTITDAPAGKFRAVIEFIGYNPFAINNIDVQQNVVTDLKTILLAKANKTLQSVTVTTTAKLIDNKIDKLVFNAEKDITSQTGVATDVLKKVPQVSVDVDGNVELAGSSSIRFLINGKPSTVFGSNISDVLQSIPASQIKSIEVITNPGAKYDAQGLGGIINFILKKNTSQGINGNLSVTAGTRMDNGSFNFNARKNNFGINAYVSGNIRPTVKTINSSQRISGDSISKTSVLLQQDGINNFKRNGFETGLGFDCTLKEKNSFTGSVSFNHFYNNGNSTINQSQVTSVQLHPENILSTINTINNISNRFSEHSIDADLNYKRTFKKEDQELDIDMNSSFGKNYITAGNAQILLPADSIFYGTNGTNAGNERETEIAIDYTQPLKKDIVLGVGGKVNFYNTTSGSNVMQLQPENNKYFYDSSLSNSLDYNQKVYALYSELSFPVAKLFDAKIGSRYERTAINSFYSNAAQQVQAPGYNTFVPSVFFIRKLSAKQTLKLSYSKRIERPDLGDLNPYINTSDPKNISTGNPYLKPEIGSRYELSYNYDLGKIGSFMVTVFYRQNNNDIQPFIVYYPVIQIGDSTYTNVSVSTRENIGQENNTGSNLYGDFHFTTKLNIRTNAFFFYRHTINKIDQGFNYNSFNYRFNVNATYQFSKTLVAEFFGNFNSARHEAQGRYPSFTSYNMALRKQFWNQKGSLALSAINPFNKYVNQETNLFGPNFNAVNVRKVPFRSIGINFTWKFGKLKFKNDEKDLNNSLNAVPEN